MQSSHFFSSRTQNSSVGHGLSCALPPLLLTHHRSRRRRRRRSRHQHHRRHHRHHRCRSR